MRPTPRTQPYRAGAPRLPGEALQAMLQGRIPGQVNVGDFERQRRQGAAQGALQQLAQQQLAQQMGGRPVATINDPNQQMQRTVDRWPGGMAGQQDLIPGHPGARGGSIQQLILAALQAAQQQRRPFNGGVAAPPFAHI